MDGCCLHRKRHARRGKDGGRKDFCLAVLFRCSLARAACEGAFAVGSGQEWYGEAARGSWHYSPQGALALSTSRRLIAAALADLHVLWPSSRGVRAARSRLPRRE